MVPTHVQLPLDSCRQRVVKTGSADPATRSRQLGSAGGIAPRCRSLVSSRNPRAGLVTSRQTFVLRCQNCVIWAASRHAAGATGSCFSRGWGSGGLFLAAPSSLRLGHARRCAGARGFLRATAARPITASHLRARACRLSKHTGQGGEAALASNDAGAAERLIKVGTS